jgi:galactose mutarotase-like enzyme
MRSPDFETALRAASTMPSLRHQRAGERFSIETSEAVDWLIKQPAVRQWTWNVLKRHGAICFEPETGRWRGATAKPINA